MFDKMGDAVLRRAFVARTVLDPNAQTHRTMIVHLVGDHADSVIEDSLAKHRLNPIIPAMGFPKGTSIPLGRETRMRNTGFTEPRRRSLATPLCGSDEFFPTCRSPRLSPSPRRPL